jgi:hypothetical protein
LAEREDLAGFEEARKARDRLDLLGGPLPAQETAPVQG